MIIGQQTAFLTAMDVLYVFLVKTILLVLACCNLLQDQSSRSKILCKDEKQMTM